ncbi:gamma-glutamyl phosphate reductase GPR [Testicularia cyperi]|uniref:glutamate-5-semialdehyde dehydrogenase n=1 Tax=Testicularia cyperi TaxID=1882483 RepID=A0A317XUX0_9BASI|nr:gamma-glutamyl phosphate reductase GPR [Testicularia cyperi]
MSSNGDLNGDGPAAKVAKTSLSAEQVAQRARDAFRASTAQLSSATGGAGVDTENVDADTIRSAALQSIAAALEANKSAIEEANRRDMEEATQLVAQGKLSASLASRLDLFSKKGKWESMVQGVRDVARLESPLDKVTWAKRLADETDTQGAIDLYRVTCPIGVLLCIFEARPEVVVNIASLALKSGNAAILKGGKESKHTASVLSSIIAQALDSSGLPPGLIQSVESREDIQSLLHLDDYIDLVIPRGSNELVKAIQRDARMPVMGHADGLCIAYVHHDAPLDLTVGTLVDAKTDYPAACNAVETLLVHQDHLKTGFWTHLATALVAAGVELRCDRECLDALPSELVSPSSAESESKSESGKKKGKVVAATEADFHTEFLDLILAVRSIPSLDAAISHISTHSSGHTDLLFTSPSTPNPAARTFTASINSANVFVNLSSRFADGFRFGLGTEVGISTGKTHARGPVGLDGLVIYKYIASSTTATSSTSTASKNNNDTKADSKAETGKTGPQTAAQFNNDRLWNHRNLPLDYPSL